MICLSWNGCLCIYFLQWISNQCIHFKLFVCFYFLATLCLHCCVWAFSSCDEQRLLFIAVHRLLIAVASLMEHRLQSRGLRQETVGLWARHLVLVKWSKTERLFSPRFSKDKASGRSWVLLKQRDKVPTTEVKEDFLSLHEQEVAWGVEKWGDPTS